MLDVFPLQDKLEDLRRLGDTVVQETCKYARESMEHLTIAVTAYICLCVVFYLATVYLKISPDCRHLRTVKRVLFVIAHPDDECMFFGPVILKLAQQSDCQIFILCLSEGDYNQEGVVRKQELWDSCRILGIPDSNITLCKSQYEHVNIVLFFMCKVIYFFYRRNSYLPDDPAVRWREDIVANLLLNHIEALSIDTVITFDKLGVSRHQNHISIFYATAYLCMEQKLPSYCKAYALESINTLRKYSAMLDIPISYLLSSYWYIISLSDRKILKTAMAAHRSQYVWFRKLYMNFSRYAVINTFKEIEILDLELDLELDD
ncbi:N-acetylglucosaminyl-phosphatidylinositol de-N-acetylase [Cryptotermes secundus]|uniref:N-acetylglucosaminylphosphatidylinositol deacetylase n=1 Tax=Cryptotermes secundus TaxID=105785 RepID=A0A2J7QH43_9NEOP|nr:N-acetylglucosaminyl-phosphatidylinositol de-N-acetylase [Cryptotermes secundus]